MADAAELAVVRQQIVQMGVASSSRPVISPCLLGLIPWRCTDTAARWSEYAASHEELVRLSEAPASTVLGASACMQSLAGSQAQRRRDRETIESDLGRTHALPVCCPRLLPEG